MHRTSYATSKGADHDYTQREVDDLAYIEN